MAYSGSVFEVLDDRLPELINKMMTAYLPGEDPLWMAQATSQGVESAGIGRQLYVRKNFHGSLTGEVIFDDSDSAILFGDAATSVGTNMYLNASESFTYPDGSGGANPAPHQMVIPLKSMKAALKMTLAEMRLDAMPDTIGEVVAPKLLGFVRNICRAHCNAFWTTDTTRYSIDTIVSARAVTTGNGYSANDTGAYELTVNRPDRFYTGQQVDIVDPDTTPANDDLRNSTSYGTSTYAAQEANRVRCYVDRVFEHKGKIVIKLQSGAWGAGGINTPTAADAIVLAQSKGKAYSGLSTWIKGDDDDSIYGVDLGLHPQHQSILKTESGSLTEQMLRRYVTLYNTSKNKYGFMIDTFVTTPGVFNAYAANKIGEQRIMRGGSSLNLNSEGTAEGMTFVHDGKTYNFKFSNWCDTGALYGLKLGGGNFKRYVPPSTAGIGRMGDVPSFAEVEFVAKSLGFPTIWVPALSSNRLTQAIYAPCDSRMEVVPEQFASLKISGLTEDTILAD